MTKEQLRAAYDEWAKAHCSPPMPSYDDWYFRIFQAGAEAASRDEPSENPAFAAGDILAHQLTFKYHGEILETWWQARGGHDKCTVCNPPPPNR